MGALPLKTQFKVEEIIWKHCDSDMRQQLLPRQNNVAHSSLIHTVIPERFIIISNCQIRNHLLPWQTQVITVVVWICVCPLAP